MKTILKKILSTGISLVVSVISSIAAGRYIIGQTLVTAMETSKKIHHQGLELEFAIPNNVSAFRINTFSSKEPETLEWLDEIPRNSVVWDIGANIGLYSCYSAKARDCRVYAFEPSVFNLELLARNVYLNNLSGKIAIIPIPLSDSLEISKLNMTTTEWGGSLSTFGQSYGHDGKPLNKVFEFQTIGMTLDQVVNKLNIPQPDYIKMDVDGIEHLILKGGSTVLQKTKGILLEVNEDFQQQVEACTRYLHDAGLKLKEKRHADMFDNTELKNSYNQIWYRP